MKALIIAEHDNHQLKPGTLNVVTAASQVTDDSTLMVIGHNVAALCEQIHIQGVKQILALDNPGLAEPIAENLTQVICQYAPNYDYIFAPASTFGKNFMPRVAARLDVGQISDISAIIDAETFMRPIYAGNAIQTVKSYDQRKVITVRTTAFDAAEINQDPIPIERVDIDVELAPTEFISRELSESDRPDLTSARVVISGGRALASSENFSLLEALAKPLNAAIGASRAAVDAGYVPNDYQVGQTGKIVAPELYIAVGISGAIQHVAGMKDSKVIVAINKDPDAPIFKIADYGLVGDLFTLIPELTKALEE